MSLPADWPQHRRGSPDPTGERPADSSVATADILLVAVGDGCQTSFADVYDLLAASVLGMSRRVLRDQALAEEVTRDVFLEVWTRAGWFDPGKGSAHTWVLALAHRRAVDRVRAECAHSAQRRSAGWTRLPAVSGAGPAAARNDTVRAAMDKLSQAQREAISLAYFGGFTHRELADRLDTTHGTIETRIRDGLRHLATHLTA